MKKYLLILINLPIFLISCQNAGNENQIGQWKNEIEAAENEFAKIAKETSISEAFIYFAADDVVIERNNSLIIGKEALIKHFTPTEPTSDKITLRWTPDFVDVSAAGDLGYTYGKYIYTKTDSTGNTTKTEGIFHTVWKRQMDGQWRYVWD